jgi:hypothetical protein
MRIRELKRKSLISMVEIEDPITGINQNLRTLTALLMRLKKKKAQNKQ